MTALELVAWGSAEVTELTADDARALAMTGAVDVAPGWQPGTWSVTAGPHVGVLRAGAAEVRIRPRIAIARLLYLLGFARDPDAWRDDPVGLDDMADLWPAMAQVFVRRAEQALTLGVLQGYRTEESAQLVMRGRLRESDQLRRRAGLAVPLEVRFDEYDVDIAENQLLRAAAERIIKVPDVSPLLTRRLRRLVARLADVRRLVPGQPLPHVSSTRLNRRYQPALSLARMILAARSVDIGNGGVRATGFLVNMNTVFEDFVTVALSRALAPYGGRCVPQDPRHRLDVGGTVKFRPDLVRYGMNGVPQAVVDVKYKAETPAGFPYADLYQALAYATGLGLGVAHLVYAEGSSEGHHLQVRNVDVQIRRHVLDLGQQVQALQGQIGVLAEHIVHY